MCIHSIESIFNHYFSFLKEHADRVMHIVSCFVETIHDAEGIKKELEHLGKKEILKNYSRETVSLFCNSFRGVPL
jgi:hypothetical protein